MRIILKFISTSVFYFLVVLTLYFCRWLDNNLAVPTEFLKTQNILFMEIAKKQLLKLWKNYEIGYAN